MPAIAKAAVFLDRDGTLNEDPGYLDSAAKLRLLPTVREALELLSARGYELIVVSNQSGVHRGLIEESEMPKIHARLNELLGGDPGGSRIGPMIRHFKLCFHRPDEGCDCRKPQPRLLLEAARELGLDLSRSFMIGDKFSDLVVGKNAGCRGSILVRTGDGRVTESKLKPGEAAYVADSLLDAAKWILGAS
ncbi:MAG TPA: HAD family hydrolase [Bdellovibrionota bacterium]|nr:HAD family hydrolase [Bdellovibrionota bacterium]